MDVYCVWQGHAVPCGVMGLPVQAALTGETTGRAFQEFPRVSTYDRLAELAQKLDGFAPKIGYPHVAVTGIPDIAGCYVELGGRSETGTHWHLAIRPTEQALDEMKPSVVQKVASRASNIALFRDNAQTDTLWSLLTRDHQGTFRELCRVDDDEGVIGEFILRVASAVDLGESSRKMARRRSDAIRKRQKHVAENPRKNKLATDEVDRKLLERIHAIGYTATTHFEPDNIVKAPNGSPVLVDRLPEWAIAVLVYDNFSAKASVATPPRARRKRNFASKVR